MYGVILAGGSGTRFWPKSRELLPKQLLKISGDKTLLQSTVERLLPLISIEKIFVVANELHAFETCRQLSEYGFDSAQLLAEPVGRNTAAAIGFAAQTLSEQGKDDEIMAVFPADHIVTDTNVFLESVRKAADAAGKGYIVTLGVKPTRPDTGYGYIKKSASLNDGVFQVERFVEKPDLPTAKQYLAEGEYFWNCGVFLWKVSTILTEIKTYMPDLREKLNDLGSHMREGKCRYRTLNPKGKAIYQSLTSVSIDYGVMEKSKKTAIVPSSMQWSDVGTWDSNIAPKDAMGNVFSQNVVALDCSDSIIQGEERLIAAVGVKNIIVVDTPDALLVCDKSQAQDVKKIVEKIKADRRPEAVTHITVQRPWGSYTVLERRDGYLLKRIDVLPGEKLSLQSHRHRSEHWVVLSGRAEVQLGEKNLTLNKGESIDIPKEAKHRLGNPGVTLLTIFEAQTGETLDENDIVRYEDSYGRS